MGPPLAARAQRTHGLDHAAEAARVGFPACLTADAPEEERRETGMRYLSQPGRRADVLADRPAAVTNSQASPRHAPFYPSA